MRTSIREIGLKMYSKYTQKFSNKSSVCEMFYKPYVEADTKRKLSIYDVWN